jgi:hypothetical protein
MAMAQVEFEPLEKGRRDDLLPGASHVLGFTKWIDRLRFLVPSPGRGVRQRSF